MPTAFDSDQRPLTDVNEWLLSLASTHSRETWWTYAREVVRFAAHLEHFGLALLSKEVAHNGDELLRAYQLQCTRPDLEDATASPVGDTASTIGKRRAAISQFYGWAVRAGRIAAMPFAQKEVRTRFGRVEVLAGLGGGRRSRVERQPIPHHQLEPFLRVGLMGLRPDGAPDPAFRGFVAAQRNAAGFALAVGAGLRHAEVLAFTVFELPLAHPDGFAPLAVADETAKGDVGRRVIAFSRWLRVVHAYVDGDRRAIAQGATWQPDRPLEVIPGRTSRRNVTFIVGGRPITKRWRDLGVDVRRRLVLPGGGSPLLLLNHRTANGAPLTDTSTLNDALRLAGARAAALWPDDEWSYSMHNLRHTYATELTSFLAHGREEAVGFQARHGRRPVWGELVARESAVVLVQESMGHASPATTQIYQHAALWNLLLSVNADPEHNPAASERVGV
jgi:integrase